MATELYRERRISAVKRRTDGFLGVLIRVNGQYYQHYGPLSPSSCRTIEGAIEQTKRDLDAIDAYDDDHDRPRFSAYLYRKSDPRYQTALKWEQS